MGLVGLDLDWVEGDVCRKDGVKTERRLSLAIGLNIDDDELVVLAVVVVVVVVVVVEDIVETTITNALNTWLLVLWCIDGS